MRVNDVLPTAGTWTNDQQSAVEFNPPGVMVQPGESLILGEDGNVTVVPAKVNEPKTEPENPITDNPNPAPKTAKANEDKKPK